MSPLPGDSVTSGYDTAIELVPPANLWENFANNNKREHNTMDAGMVLLLLTIIGVAAIEIFLVSRGDSDTAEEKD